VIGVVIVSYRTRDRTVRAAESALADGAERVVVVDNASDDGTVGTLRGLAEERLTVLENPRNTGFGAACNQGAAACGDVRHLLFLNGDTAVQPGALDALVNALEDDPAVGIAAPALIDDTGAHQPSRRGDPTPLALLHQHTALRFLRFGSAAYRRYKSPEPADPAAVLMGAAPAVRGSVFRAAGGFDPRHFLYFEEADLCRRVRAAGHTIRLVDGAVVQHAGGVSAAREPERALVLYLQSLFVYVDRFHGRARGLAYRIAFKPLFLLRMVTDAVRDALTVLFRPAKRVEKLSELRLAAGFFLRGVWRFAVA